MSSSGKWLEKALVDLSGKIETGLILDADLISGLVSYCELAPPQDAAEYLLNIIGEDAIQSIAHEYLERRGYVGTQRDVPEGGASKLVAYVKPPVDERPAHATKKQTRIHKEGDTVDMSSNMHTEASRSSSVSLGNSGVSKKKKSGKVVSLAEAAKGSIVFQKGQPCSCQARRHKLVSNCLSCGKIVCEQEGEGPCSFCGALVLREGSTYAGLESTEVHASYTESAAEAFAKRLVEYDRNSAARTTVIDDQSDYYEIEGNTWLSNEEKALLLQKETEKAEEKRKNKIIVTFDLLGRKVVVNEDEAQQLKSEYRLLRPPEERELGRIKPNPTARVQPTFVDTGFSRNPNKAKQAKSANGLCLEISGRVQREETLIEQR